MKRLIHRIRHLTSKEYEHRQVVILGLVAAIAILAYAFNRYVLNRSVIIVNVAYPNITLTLDGQALSPTKIDEDTYKFVTIPGKHTLTIKSGDDVNHRQIITARAGFTLELTPALSIAPNPASDELGEVGFISRSSDDTQLFYLGQNGTELVLYDLPTRIRTAISDPVFRNVTKLKWAPDHHATLVQDTSRNWYYFDFAKSDFIHAEFHEVANPSVIDADFDPVHNRVGLIEYRDNKAVFATADAGFNNIDVLTILDKQQPSQITWSPDGHLVALLDQAASAGNNLVFYDLANDKQIECPISGVTRAEISPDSKYALVEHQSGANNVLSVFNMVDSKVSDLGNLTVSGAATWQDDSAHLVALFKTADTPSSLVNIDVTTSTVTPFRNTLSVSQPVDYFYLADNANTLYFVSNKILYSFPLTLHN